LAFWELSPIPIHLSCDRAYELGEWVYSSMLMLFQAWAAAGRGDSTLEPHRLREAFATARKQEVLVSSDVVEEFGGNRGATAQIEST
jgi:hypothetical protein